MKTCSNLFYLSALACQLGQCLSKDQLSVLSADLVVLSDLLASMLVREALCSSSAQENNSTEEPAPANSKVVDYSDTREKISANIMKDSNSGNADKGKTNSPENSDSISSDNDG